MKITLTNIGGIRLGSGGTLYTRGAWSQSAATGCSVFAGNANCNFCPDADLTSTPDIGNPKLEVNPGRIWLDVNIATNTGGGWTRGGYLGTRTVDFRFYGGRLGTSGVTVQQNFLAVIPGAYTGGLKVEGLDNPPTAWTSALQPNEDGDEYYSWARVGTWNVNSRPIYIQSAWAHVRSVDPDTGVPGDIWLDYFAPACFFMDIRHDIALS